MPWWAHGLFFVIVVLLWGGVMVKYFWNDIREKWRNRNDPRF